MTMRPVNNNKQMAGFTLVEMLISTAISVVLIGGVLGIAMGVMGSSAKNLKRTHLTQELRATMSLMVRDMRRAGFNGKGFELILDNVNNPFTQAPYMLTVKDGKDDCVLYAYDEDADGKFDKGNNVDERQGFRLKHKKVQTFKGLNGKKEFSCKSSGWESLTSGDIKITKLEFDATNQKCFNVSVVPNVEVPDCNPAKVPADQIMAKLISVNIALKGELKSDSSVVREVTDSVKIRNVQTTLGI